MSIEYKIPILLENIMNWERMFSREVQYLENPTGLFLGIDFYEKEGYFCTPVDSFTIASTGSDGIHFALLTDFRLVKDLNKAPVIRITPMDSERVRLVARNLREFFCLHFFDELALLNDYTSEEEYLMSVRNEETKDLNSEWFDHNRWKRERQKVLYEIKDRFKLKPITNPVQYLHEIRLERNLQVIKITEDSLGIMPLSKRIPQEEAELLAVIRNLQHNACSDENTVQRHASLLHELGLTHEAEALLSRLL